MAKTKSKGTSLLAEISAVYTAIPNLTSIGISGEASEVFNARTLDGTVHSEQLNTGYVSNPEISAEGFYDSGNAVHVFLKTSMRTPPAAGVNFKLTDVASSPLSTIWNVTGIGFDETYANDDGVKFSLKCQTSGNNS